MSNSVDTKVSELLQQWVSAKDAETQWKTYRQTMEDQITALLGGFEGDLKALEAGNTLTKTIKLPGIAITIGHELKLLQTETASFLADYPMMHGVLIKSTYEPTGTRQLLTAAGQDNDLAKALQKIFERKVKRPSYSIAGSA